MSARLEENVRFRKLFMNSFKTVHEQVCQKGFGKLITLKYLIICVDAMHTLRSVDINRARIPYTCTVPYGIVRR